VADASEDDAVGDLREEVVLEEGVVDVFGGGEAGGHEAEGFEADEFGDGDDFFEAGEATGWEVEFLYEDCLVHKAVPVDAGFHVAFPLVEIDVVAELLVTALSVVVVLTW
jgi:hypothetical protein